jgi:hypothetical protein
MLVPEGYDWIMRWDGDDPMARAVAGCRQHEDGQYVDWTHHGHTSALAIAIAALLARAA